MGQLTMNVESKWLILQKDEILPPVTRMYLNLDYLVLIFRSASFRHMDKHAVYRIYSVFVHVPKTATNILI